MGGLLLATLLQHTLPSLLARGGEAPLLDLAPDARFIIIALFATVVVAFLFGLYPAWKSSRLDLTSVLRRASGGARSGGLPMGRVLVTIQVGLSLILLIAAGTFLRTVSNLRSLSLGFVPEKLLVFSTDPSLAGHRGDRVLAFYDEALRRLSSSPGVKSASLSRHGLLQPSASSSGFTYRDETGQNKSLGSSVHGIAPGYFDTVGIPLLAGRDVRSTDTPKAQRVVLVNQKLARLIRPDGGSPVGLSLYEGNQGASPMEIVGVAGDAKYDDIRKDTPPTVYRPFQQTNIRAATIFVKTNGDPMRLAGMVRQVMTSVDPQVPIFDLRTQEEQISLAIERERILAKLLAVFGLLALSLAAVGIYGVISYAVTRRTSEMGIRLALGAAPGTIRAMIVRESLPPIVIGGICGSIGAWSFTQLLDGFLFGVKPMDAWSVAGALGVLTAVALLAAIIPALRASRVTPMKALRYE
jgi:predicted permease